VKRNPQAKLVRGDKLTDAQRRQVLNAFIYRLTFENQRQHPAQVKQAGGRVTMSDGQWIREHAFRFTKSGQLSGRWAEPHFLAENPAGIRAQVRRLPSGQVQIKIPLKGGRRGNPVRIESPNGDRLTRGIRIVERYGDTLLRRGNDPKFVAKVAREALGNWVQQATVVVDDGKGGRAYNPQDRYEVIVGNIGSVYSGNSLKEANRKFSTYVRQSRQGTGRAAGEDVTMMRDGEPFKENYGKLSVDRQAAEYNPRGRRMCNPPRGEVDHHAATELELYVDNDGDLYRQQYQPILKNLATKKARGIYQHHLAVKLFMYLMESGAKKYAKEFSVGTDWSTMFNVPTRLEVAERFAKHFETEYDTAAYNHLLPKKYQPKTT
jgi:hypothetical protein